MLFEVFGPDKQGKMCTDYPNLVPWDDIPTMSKFGYTFRWNGKAISKSVLMAKRNETPDKYLKASVPVSGILCIETGKVYAKQSEAARDMNIDPAQVSDSIKTGRPRSGYTFQKV